MIAIEVTLSPRDPNTAVAESLIESSYQNIYNFFKSCVDKKLVLNVCYIDPRGRGLPGIDVSRYFATTIQLAQEFEQAFTDMSAEFSYKKFWDQKGFDVSFSYHEIDFDTVQDTVEVVSESGSLWDLKF